MSCASCEQAVQRVALSVPGVVTSRASFASSCVKVEFNSAITTPSKIAAEISTSGYSAYVSNKDIGQHLLNHHQRLAENTRQLKHKSLSSLLLATPILVLTMLPGEVVFLPGESWLMTTLSKTCSISGPISYKDLVVSAMAMIMQCFHGREIHQRAIRSIRAGVLGMDFLVSFGSAAAFLVGCLGLASQVVSFGHFSRLLGAFAETHAGHNLHNFETSTTLIALVLFGRFLEALVKQRTSSLLSKLAQLQRQLARLVTIPIQEPIPPELIASVPTTDTRADFLYVGDIVKVLPTDFVPSDGIIVCGAVEVDTSTVTGEGMPVLKREGCELATGSRVCVGTALVKIVRTGEESTLGRILTTVTNAQTSRAPSQSLTDSILRSFTKGVMYLSAVTFICWFFASSTLLPGCSPISQAFSFALSVWVAACPCALGLAEPLAVLISMTKFAELGLLVKDAQALQSLAEARIAVFDKTGTLTQGQPTVEEVISCRRNISRGPHAQEAPIDIGLARSLQLVESDSRHPIAISIVQYCLTITKGSEEVGICPHVQYKVEYPGLGMTSVLSDGTRLVVGSENLLAQELVDSCMLTPDILGEAEKWRHGGGTAVFVARNGVTEAVLHITDRPRAEAAKTIHLLKSRHNMSCWMLSGDNITTAKTVASKVGIPLDNVIANALPHDKAEKIAILERTNGKVVFVGDGVNDSPALVAASVGVSLGNQATEIAKEASDVVLMSGNLLSLVYAKEFSLTVVRRMRLNVMLAIVYNALCLPLATGILFPMFKLRLQPSLAGLMMVLSSLSVVLSSYQLLLYKTPTLTSSYDS